MNNQFNDFRSVVNNPKQAVLNVLGNNNTPMIQNLLKMAKNNDYKGIETFARNYLKEQGRDFDTEMQQLQQYLNSFK